MKSNEVGTTLKHPESFHGNVKNLSKRMKMKIKKNVTFNITMKLLQKPTPQLFRKPQINLTVELNLVSSWILNEI